MTNKTELPIYGFLDTPDKESHYIKILSGDFSGVTLQIFDVEITENQGEGLHINFSYDIIDSSKTIHIDPSEVTREKLNPVVFEITLDILKKHTKLGSK